MMMAALAFFQPFKHPEILSINTGAQIAVLFVLFAAMFLLVNGSGSNAIAVMLVLSAVVPLVAGVALTLRLPAEAIVRQADDAFSSGLSSLASSAKTKMKLKRAKSKTDDSMDVALFGGDNPMHAGGLGARKERGARNPEWQDVEVSADGGVLEAEPGAGDNALEL